MDFLNKLQNFWQTLDEKQQIYAWISSAVLVILLLIVSLYWPLKAKNQFLNEQLHIQNTMRQQLLSVQNVGHFSTLPNPIKKTLINLAKRKGLNIQVTFENKQLTLNMNNQDFSALRDFLLSLRMQYAITVNKATLKKTKNGFVDANLILSMP